MRSGTVVNNNVKIIMCRNDNNGLFKKFGVLFQHYYLLMLLITQNVTVGGFAGAVS